jgi:hypothetical protein
MYTSALVVSSPSKAVDALGGSGDAEAAVTIFSPAYAVMRVRITTGEELAVGRDTDAMDVWFWMSEAGTPKLVPSGLSERKLTLILFQNWLWAFACVAEKLPVGKGTDAMDVGVWVPAVGLFERKCRLILCHISLRAFACRAERCLVGKGTGAVDVGVWMPVANTSNPVTIGLSERNRKLLTGDGSPLAALEANTLKSVTIGLSERKRKSLTGDDWLLAVVDEGGSEVVGKDKEVAMERCASMCLLVCFFYFSLCVFQAQNLTRCWSW